MPVAGSDELKRTNEIGMATSVLEPIAMAGKTLTADALLTQRKLAEYLIERDAHDLFTTRDDQPTLAADICLHFAARGEPDFREPPSLQHGRTESRAIWTSSALNHDLEFPHVGQVFAIERHTINKKTGKTSTEIVYGVTDHTPDSADPTRLLAFSREHWGIEAHHDILD